MSRKAGKKKIARIHFDRVGNSLYCLGFHVILLGSLLNILEGFHSMLQRKAAKHERKGKEVKNAFRAVSVWCLTLAA